MEKIVCSDHAPKAAWRVPRPAPYKVLNDTVLPWITRDDGKTVMYWHLANPDAYPHLEKWLQIALIKTIWSELNHEIAPLRMESSEFREGAEQTYYWVGEDDIIHMPDGSSFKSPFLFSKSPSTIAVQYAFHPGYEFSLDCFIDGRKKFAEKDGDGAFGFVVVGKHEGLHMLGADHTEVKNEILEAVYNPNAKLTGDTRAVLNILLGKSRLDAIRVDPAMQFIRRNILIQAGRDPDDPSKEFVAPITAPKKKIHWLKRLWMWIRKLWT